MMSKDQPKEEFLEFAERLVITCCARGISKARMIEKTGLKKSRLNSYQDATRFFHGREITTPDGALRKISRELNVLSIWLTEGERSVLRSDIRDAIEEFEALPQSEQLKRAQELGWWRERGRPQKPPNSGPSK
jgi:hypothetical protein